MITSNLCDYRNSYIRVKETIIVLNTAAAGAAVNNTNKNVIFKNCAPFTDCITEINNIQIDDAQKIVVVIPMCNLMEYSDAYSKTSGSLWQYCRDEPALGNNGNIIDFLADNNNSVSLNLNKKQHNKQKTVAQKMLK